MSAKDIQESVIKENRGSLFTTSNAYNHNYYYTITIYNNVYIVSHIYIYSYNTISNYAINRCVCARMCLEFQKEDGA